MSLRTSFLHPLLNGFLILLLFWLAGFIVFANDVMMVPLGNTNHKALQADGIVVLTGGRERLPAGFGLLAKGAAPRLLISGVDPHVSSTQLLQKLVPPDYPARDKLDCCVTFGTFAEDTTGNAVEAAAWAEKFKMKTVVLVTANYHMRRSLVEFRQEMPGVHLIAFAVEPEQVRVDAWWEYPGTASLLMSEYTKCLFAYGKAWFMRLME